MFACLHYFMLIVPRILLFRSYCLYEPGHTRSLEIKEQKSKGSLKHLEKHQNNNAKVILLCHHTWPAKVDAITAEDFMESFTGTQKGSEKA